jgi:proline dehydrogenase
VLRSLILAAADSPRLRRFVDQYGMRLDAARFVGGETLDQVVVTLRGLNDKGRARTRRSSEAEQVRPAARLGNCTVLQAYLYRTPRDLESLLPLRPNLRPTGTRT